MQNKLMLGLVVAFIVVAGVLAACAPAAPQAQPTSPAGSAPGLDGAALVNSRCTACHNQDRIKQAKKTPDQWKATVTRMVVTNGAKLNADEQAAVIAYLAKTYGP